MIKEKKMAWNCGHSTGSIHVTGVNEEEVRAKATASISKPVHCPNVKDTIYRMGKIFANYVSHKGLIFKT